MDKERRLLQWRELHLAVGDGGAFGLQADGAGSVAAVIGIVDDFSIDEDGDRVVLAEDLHRIPFAMSLFGALGEVEVSAALDAVGECGRALERGLDERGMFGVLAGDDPEIARVSIGELHFE